MWKWYFAQIEKQLDVSYKSSTFHEHYTFFFVDMLIC